MNRRELLCKTMYVSLFAFLSPLVGCPSMQSIEAVILTWVPVGLQAFSIIAAMIPGGAALTPLIALVKAGFADVQIALTAYKNAPDADKLTLRGKIATALAVLEGNLNTFWTSLSIPDSGLQATIVSLLGLLLSTLTGLSGQFTANAAAPATADTARLRTLSAARGLRYTARKRSVGEFKGEFNQVLMASSYKGDLLK